MPKACCPAKGGSIAQVGRLPQTPAQGCINSMTALHNQAAGHALANLGEAVARTVRRAAQQHVICARRCTGSYSHWQHAWYANLERSMHAGNPHLCPSTHWDGFEQSARLPVVDRQGQASQAGILLRPLC